MSFALHTWDHRVGLCFPKCLEFWICDLPEKNINLTKEHVPSSTNCGITVNYVLIREPIQWTTTRAVYIARPSRPPRVFLILYIEALGVVLQPEGMQRNIQGPKTEFHLSTWGSLLKTSIIGWVKRRENTFYKVIYRRTIGKHFQKVSEEYVCQSWKVYWPNLNCNTVLNISSVYLSVYR